MTCRAMRMLPPIPAPVPKLTAANGNDAPEPVIPEDIAEADPWFPLCPSDAVRAVAVWALIFLVGCKAWLS